MKTPLNKIANATIIYGGAFCPIHFGHINVACYVDTQIQADQFLFLPCKAPVLDKRVSASVEHRVAMLKRALEPYPMFQVDLSEIERHTPSYMVDTLRDFRHKRGMRAPIILLIGMDCFLQLPRWHHWEALLHFAHLLVIDRPDTVGSSFSEPLQTLLARNQTMQKSDLLTLSYGKIYRMNAGRYAISSTAIREAIRQGRDTSLWLPAVVRQYIDEHALFGAGSSFEP